MREVSQLCEMAQDHLDCLGVDVGLARPFDPKYNIEALRWLVTELERIRSEFSGHTVPIAS